MTVSTIAFESKTRRLEGLNEIRERYDALMAFAVKVVLLRRLFHAIRTLRKKGRRDSKSL